MLGPWVCIIYCQSILLTRKQFAFFGPTDAPGYGPGGNSQSTNPVDREQVKATVEMTCQDNTLFGSLQPKLTRVKSDLLQTR